MVRPWKLPMAVWPLVMAIAGVVLLGGADEKRATDGFSRVKVESDELIEDTGLDCYKFELPGVRGRPFDLVYRVVEAEGAVPKVVCQVTFRPRGNQTPVVRVSLLRNDRQLAGFLLSGYPKGEFRISAPNCTPSGFATVLDNPLKDAPPTERAKIVYRSEAESGHTTPGELLLLKAARTDPANKRGVKMVYPRMELVVVKAE